MASSSGPSSAKVISKEEERPLVVRELGFTQVDGHPADHPFVADVVFVHGLQGHPKKTWQSKSSTKARKTFGKYDEGRDDDGLFWPAELLPGNFNDVRVLTYGYDSRVTKGWKESTSKNGIFEHGGSLLQSPGDRQGPNLLSRPANHFCRT